MSTALSTHTACLICRDKRRSLHRVKKQDIFNAYVNNKIFIKDHARCCDAHLDENGLIRKEEFFIMPTKNEIYPANTIKMFDLLLKNNISCFDQFQDLKYLEEEHCKKITGWSKDEFIRFSNYITSVHDTKQRNKEQLIALYRYWLQTGIDQKSLPTMFGKNINQKRISEYLSQIRIAIYKDFVPFFLGANKTREFYLKYNTVMTHSLYDLPNDHLVIVADGTYCKIEKSQNNAFQYNTYSVQKCTSLFKPFIICCADGYIIDCYGPFAANKNDSSILNYIIETDNDLKSLLVQNKTLILLDRGMLIYNIAR